MLQATILLCIILEDNGTGAGHHLNPVGLARRVVTCSPPGRRRRLPPLHRYALHVRLHLCVHAAYVHGRCYISTFVYIDKDIPSRSPLDLTRRADAALSSLALATCAWRY